MSTSRSKISERLLLPLIYLELTAISIIDVAISILIQRKIASTEKTYHLQAKMKKHMDDLKQLSESKAPQEHIVAKQKEITDTMSESMRHQFRATPVLLVVSLLLYFLILPELFPIPWLSIAPVNPGVNQSVLITAQAPPGTNNTVGIWLSGGSYGSGNLISSARKLDNVTATYPPGNYTVMAYDLNTSAYSPGLPVKVNAANAASTKTNETTTPVYNLLVVKIAHPSFQDNIFFIVITLILSLAVQSLLGRRDKARFDAKVKSGEIKI